MLTKTKNSPRNRRVLTPLADAGDRVFWRNTFGQEFYATVIRMHQGLLIVQRDEWQSEECLDLNASAVRYRIFKPDALTRSQKIDAIVQKCAKPCPEIVPVKLWYHPSGRTCAITSTPTFGVSPESQGWEMRDAGFAYRDARNGTTFGTRAKTEQELRDRHTEHETQNATDLRKALEEMTDKRLQESFEYWQSQK